MSLTRPLDSQVFVLAQDAECNRIAEALRDYLRQSRRRGLVVAISGGIDSSLCAALAVAALGSQRVFGLLMPEADSSPASLELGLAVTKHLGIDFEQRDIAPTLEAIGCYASRDEAIRRVVPAYGEGWKSKITIAGGLEGGFNFFRLVVQDPQGHVRQRRLPLAEYLQIVAGTNYKQRIRKTIEYATADRLNYAVVGTPNRLEYELGFFVKNGDGSADVKPIAHLYKTQVYALARHCGLPAAVCDASPTTDTYSMPQSQDEFYFALPYPQMDLALWAHDQGVSVAELAVALDLSEQQAGFIYRDIESKRSAARYLHGPPALLAPLDRPAAPE